MLTSNTSDNLKRETEEYHKKAGGANDFFGGALRKGGARWGPIMGCSVISAPHPSVSALDWITIWNILKNIV